MVGATTNPENISGYLVSDLINLSLRQIGIGAMGTTPSDEDISDGVMHLNMMLAQWQRKRWMVPCLIDLAFPVTESKSIFYIGPGGDLDIPSRPDKLNACYCRLLYNNNSVTPTPPDNSFNLSWKIPDGVTPTYAYWNYRNSKNDNISPNNGIFYDSLSTAISKSNLISMGKKNESAVQYATFQILSKIPGIPGNLISINFTDSTTQNCVDLEVKINGYDYTEIFKNIEYSPTANWIYPGEDKPELGTFDLINGTGNVILIVSENNSSSSTTTNNSALSTNGQFVDDQFSDEFNTATDGLDNGQNPLDFPLTSLGSYEDYSSIGLKGLRAFPSFYFYNPSFTLGELRISPIPSGANWEVHILCKSILPNNLKATDTINLPSEYADAIMWMLAVRLAPSYGQEASETVSIMAKSCMDLIRTANVQIPRLGMPAELNSGNNPFYWPGLQYTKL